MRAPESADALIDAGLVPFAICNHGGDQEWTPVHYRLSKVATLISCVICLRSFGNEDVDWLTPYEASQRHGWTVVDSAATPTDSRP